jgi:hypothetical protein
MEKDIFKMSKMDFGKILFENGGVDFVFCSIMLWFSKICDKMP